MLTDSRASPLLIYLDNRPHDQLLDIGLSTGHDRDRPTAVSPRATQGRSLPVADCALSRH